MNEDKIVLSNDQLINYSKIKNIWKKSIYAINLSVMGSGKTYVSSKLLMDMFESGFVICPASVIIVWNYMKFKYSLNIEIISYESLSSVKNNQPNHDYLIRDDSSNEVNFKVTDKFKNYIKDGCLLIIDEYHRIKNDNSRHSAVKALTNYIIKKKGQNRILFMSGSPYDNKEQIINMLQTINVIKSKDLDLTEFNELINYCKKINYEETCNILNSNMINSKNIHNLCFMLYTDIIQPKISVAMPSPKIEYDLHCYNGYFHMSNENEEKLEKAVKLLSSAKKNEDSVTTALRKIQVSKVEIFVRLANIYLKKNKFNKVCLYFDFDEPILLANKLLSDWDPVIITGKIDKKNRPHLINKFQENNSESRLLIFNMAVGSEGINLHDIHGDYPRYVFAAPSYYILRMHQMTRRFYRVGTKSNTEICFVYGNSGTTELSLINSLSKKSIIMKETLIQQVKEGIKFPIDYEEYFEKEISFEDLILTKKINDSNENIENIDSKSSSKQKKISIKNIVLMPNISNNFDFQLNI